MLRFDFTAASGGGGGSSTPATTCVPKFEPKYEPNLSMQQRSPISLTTAAGNGIQHTP